MLSAWTCERLPRSTRSATASVMSTSSWLRCLRVRSPSPTTASRTTLMLTSWSEQLTPPALSMASVLMRPPPSAYSMRPRCVKPRLPPSPTTRQRSSAPSTRTPSLALSPTSALPSVVALTYVPMPPFHRRSTGARSSARMSSLGVSASASMPSAARAGPEMGIDFAVRGHTPPPSEISEAS
jgi:hypothetical protein